MSDANLRQIRVLHLVSAGGVASSLQQSLFMPLLTRLPRPRVKAQVACLSPGAVPSAVLRQNGVPTFDLALSRKRFSPKAFQELLQSTRHFRPDVIQAWGHTAQVISVWLRSRCDWKPRLVWSVSDTVPLPKNAGVIDRQKLKHAAKFSARADRIVYASEAGASQHRRVGFPEGGHETIPPGVDATRFKPDFAARRKLREELSLPGETFVIGMMAPFQPEYDHTTLLKAIGELVKINPHIAVVLAGHGVQKGNAPLMALVGGGALATRVHLMGEWSDVNALYNACDVVCSSALNDQSRMNIVMAMLCGVPCVATGIGAQGEVIGQHGVAIEPGSSAAFVKGITRVMQLPPEKRTHMAQGARKHALANYVYVRSLQKYLQLYYDLIGRQSLVTKDLPTPEIDATLTVPPALPTEAELNVVKRKPVSVAEWGDPDSLESKVSEREPEELPKWRLDQEQERAKREAELAQKVAASKSVGDVLQVFESQNQKAAGAESPMTERARGVADDSEELLSPEMLAADAPSPPRVSNAPSGAKKSSTPAAAPSAPPQDAAKQAALKAARMAALQPITPAPKTAGASKPLTRPAVTPIAASKPLTRPAVTPVAESKPLITPAATPPVAPAIATIADKIDIGSTQPLDALPGSALPDLPELDIPGSSVNATLATAIASAVEPAPALEPVDLGSTQPLGVLTHAAAVAAAKLIDHDGAAKLETSSAQTSRPDAAAAAPVDPSPTQSLELPDDLLAASIASASAAPTSQPVVSAHEPSKSAASEEDDLLLPSELLLVSVASDTARNKAPSAPVPTPTAGKAPSISVASSVSQSVSVPVTAAESAPAVADASPGHDFSELALMATGQWQALQRSDGKKAETTQQGTTQQSAKSDELSGPEALSLISKPAPPIEPTPDPTVQLALLPDPQLEPKRAANGE